VTTGSNWNVGALGAGMSYVGPWISQANYCSCSSVVYNLVSACAACQNDVWVPWSEWSSNCSTSVTTLGQWPLDIPAGTAVPAYAYINPVIHGNTFNLTLAQNATGPQSTYFGTPTASINYHLSTSATSGTTPVVTATVSVVASAAAAKSTSTPVGAIVGGVIGGLVVLGLLGLLIFLLRRKNTKYHSGLTAEPYTDHSGGQMGQTGHGTADFATGYPTSPTIFNGSVPGPQKLYDPSDPTTFPGSPASIGYQSTAAHTASTYPLGSQDSAGRYTGAAEI